MPPDCMSRLALWLRLPHVRRSMGMPCGGAVYPEAVTLWAAPRDPIPDSVFKIISFQAPQNFNLPITLGEHFQS